ncbi:hypothetical protein AB4G91_02800 [Macrococcoides goetzii]|uniref:hypothetical protein n=1 Tax=Macrococcus sp. PK TaxID=2801919 RepID=UPI001F0D470E|nr:hypothetical protein [Macrococcus sp. PK]MCH4984229.1 hypothetical protein [Macrococcus sp. PK]
MKQIYLYDDNHLFIGVDVVESNNKILPEKFTDIAPPDGLYRPKFDGEQWIETITQDELDELNKVTTLISDTERIDALEGAMIEIFETLS